MINIKKVLILSFHANNNYGAVLQNYALQTAIRDLGFRVETLDYLSEAIPFLNYTRVWRKSTKGIGNYIKKLARYLLFYKKMHARINAFQHFRATYLSLTKRVMKHELPTLDGQYDVYIAGSDQVWNVNVITEDEVDTYTLQFIQSEPRAAYAASAGSCRNITPALVERISTLDYVSVREHSLKELLERRGLTGVRDACDPVFLLEKERWEQLLPISAPHEKPYVFAYLLCPKELPQDIRRLSRAIAAERGLKIFHVDRRIGFGTSRYEIGPVEWLSHIAHADAVVLSSFHGLAFSIIFEKEFFLIHRPTMEDRTRDLLELLGLSDRAFDSYEEYCLRKDSIRPIDWRAVKEKLAVLQKSSWDTLRDICNLSENHA